MSFSFSPSFLFSSLMILSWCFVCFIGSEGGVLASFQPTQEVWTLVARAGRRFFRKLHLRKGLSWLSVSVTPEFSIKDLVSLTTNSSTDSSSFYVHIAVKKQIFKILCKFLTTHSYGRKVSSCFNHFSLRPWTVNHLNTMTTHNLNHRELAQFNMWN